jgi:hypothetical protein
MVTHYTLTLDVEHDPEMDTEQIREAIEPTLDGMGILFVRKPGTTDKDVRNQEIDPVSLCYVAKIDGVRDVARVE